MTTIQIRINCEEFFDNCGRDRCWGCPKAKVEEERRLAGRRPRDREKNLGSYNPYPGYNKYRRGPA